MILYLVKAGLLSFLFYAIYKAVLQSNLNFKFNRFYLLTVSLMTLLLPFIRFEVSLEPDNDSLLSRGVKNLEELNQNLIVHEFIQPITEAEINWLSDLLIVYTAIVIFFLFRLLYRIYKLYDLNQDYAYELQGLSIYYHPQDKGIFSLFNRLYLPDSMRNQNLDAEIFKHEHCHFAQKHSIDRLWMEFFVALFWINPFAWLLRKALIDIHEFLADQAVLTEHDQTDYMQKLLQHLSSNLESSISNHFSYSSLKTRIKMIQKHKHPSASKLRISLSLLLTIGIMSLFSFRTIDIERQIDQHVSHTGIGLFDKPAGLPIKAEQIREVASEFGMRYHPIEKVKKLHTGVDLVAPKGTQILATGDGRIVKAEYSENYGNHIVIQHNVKYSSMYAHLESIKVEPGDQVKTGDQIGLIGNTGQSLGIHLHYELIEYGVKVDPEIQVED